MALSSIEACLRTVRGDMIAVLDFTEMTNPLVRAVASK